MTNREVAASFSKGCLPLLNAVNVCLFRGAGSVRVDVLLYMTHRTRTLRQDQVCLGLLVALGEVKRGVKGTHGILWACDEHGL